MSEKFFFNPEVENRVSLPKIEDIRPLVDNEIRVRI